jgi:hypothetical protein
LTVIAHGIACTNKTFEIEICRKNLIYNNIYLHEQATTLSLGKPAWVNVIIWETPRLVKLPGNKAG